MNGHIYIFHRGDFRDAKKNIYKIGYTGQKKVETRINQYRPKGDLIFSDEFINVKLFEKYLIKIFKCKFIFRRDFGLEYFEGDINIMIKTIKDSILVFKKDGHCDSLLKNGVKIKQIVKCNKLAINNSDNKNNKNNNNNNNMNMNTMKYKCSICNYYTNKKSNYDHHNKSIKHNNNVYTNTNKALIKPERKVINIGDFNCSFCNKNYSNKLQLKFYESFINSTPIITDSFSTINAIACKYTNAPSLESCKINDYGFQKNKDFYNKLLLDYKNGVIGKTLGDLIIKKYKKNNKTLQSIWSSKSLRKTFFIKSEYHWQIDKKGIIVSSELIHPLTRHLLSEYNNKINELLKQPYNDDLMNLMIKFSKDLNNNKIVCKILKYIKPEFHFDEK